ncbi:hypothetical protein HNQ92_002713 [Rhabdobacter roseus]|uniref:Uncharacterized protein n=1 Tax=Rhabdobacter roseus TaxID=1655419 RepID=A0A840TXB3_9BACT|nr:hypothetical protein [Rhabdobacter roseus]MBB5284570.1 hypothetical protein [Rhabdobacter roseus]
MKKSNIFALVEISKLAAGLARYPDDAQKALLSQAAYFLIIDPIYFSEALRPEWEAIQAAMTQREPLLDEKGFTIMNRVVHTVHQLSPQEQQDVVRRVIGLHDRLQEESLAYA